MSQRSGKRRRRRGRELVVSCALSAPPGLTDYERELLLPVAEKILSELFGLSGSDDAQENRKDDEKENKKED